MSNQNILEMKNITKKFPGVIALDNVDFSLQRQSIHALVGQNGAGKSTLMNVLTGTLPKDSGNIYIDGEKVKIDTVTDSISNGLAYMHQEISIFPDMSVAENIFIGNFPLKGLTIGYKDIYKESEKVLKKIGTAIDPKRKARGLGVGELQMIMIARLLTGQSKIIIMDEPTSSLDSKETQRLFEVIRTLAKDGHSVIYISHFINEIFDIADTVTVLRNGKKMITEKISNITEKEVIEHMLGFKEESKKFVLNENIGEVVLQVKNLSKPRVLDDISFEIRKGEVLGIAGHLGSKRTELLRAIFGADPVASGEILLNGKPIKIKSPTDAVHKGIGLLTEERGQGIISLFPIKRNITLTNLKKISNFFGIDFKKEEKFAKEYIDLLDVKASSPSQIIVNLSGGNQQKVIIAKWLYSDAKVLLLDEPTKGVDVGAKLEILYLILDLARKGLSVIMVSSELNDLAHICNRVLIMRRGRIIKELKDDISDSNLQALVNE